MVTGLELFIPVIYFEVRKNVMVGRCNWMVCQVHSHQGETSMSIVLPLGHMPLQSICWCDDMAHVGPRQPEGGCSDPSFSTACNELIPRGPVLTSSICRLIVLGGQTSPPPLTRTCDRVRRPASQGFFYARPPAHYVSAAQGCSTSTLAAVLRRLWSTFYVETSTA